MADWETAPRRLPSGWEAAPKKKVTPVGEAPSPDSSSAWSYVNPLGIAEVPTAVLGGLATQSVAGLAGAVKAALEGPEAGAQEVKKIEGAVEPYIAPETKSGQILTEAAGLPAKAVEWLANKDAAWQAKRSPAAAALAKATVETLPLALGFTKGADIADAVKMARKEGMRLTPTEMGAGVVPSSAASIANEAVLARRISRLNQGLWKKLVSKDVGIKPGDTLNRNALEDIREREGKTYELLRKAGRVKADPQFHAQLNEAVSDLEGAARDFEHRQKAPIREIVDSLKKPASFDADSAVSEIRNLRADAKKAFRSGDTELGRGALQAASALEGLLDRHIDAMGFPGSQVLDAFRQSRARIAKTYLADKAINPITGEVNPQVYAKALRDGVPLSGEGRTIGELASIFPRSAQRPTHMPAGIQYGDVLMAMLRGAGGSLAKELPWMFARPAIREVLASPIAQSAMSSTVPVLPALGVASVPTQSNK